MALLYRVARDSMCTATPSRRAFGSASQKGIRKTSSDLPDPANAPNGGCPASTSRLE